MSRARTSSETPNSAGPANFVESRIMVDPMRVRKYAETLRRTGTFIELVLNNIMIGIFQQGTRKLSGKSKTINMLQFYQEAEKLGALSKMPSAKLTDLFLNFFDEEEFWLQKAEWILTRLDEWDAGNEVPADCVLPGILSIQPDSNDLREGEEITWREADVTSACAFYTASELLQKSNLLNCKLEEDFEEFLEEFLRPRKNEKLRASPQPLFLSKSEAQVITAAPSRTAGRSLIQCHNWIEQYPGQEDSAVYFPDKYSVGSIDLSIKDLNPEKQEYMLFAGKAAWGIIKQFEQFGKDAVKLHWILSAYAFQQCSNPWEISFKLYAVHGDESLIKLMGWSNRTDLSTASKLNRIDHCLRLLRKLDATIKWDLGKVSCDMNSMIWHIDIKRYGQRNFVTGNVDNPSELEVNVQVGKWAEFFFNKHGQKAKTALYEFGWLAKSTLKIDPYHQELAFLIAVNLTADSAIRLNGEYEVRTLLAMCLAPTEIESACRDHRLAHKLKQRWDRALGQLKNLEWTVEYNIETYPEWLRPNSESVKPKDCEHKTINLLLGAKVTIKPPGRIPALIAAKTETKTKTKTWKRKEAPPNLEWENVLKACKAMNWDKQSLIATKLGVSQPLVSQLQGGKRISPQTATKLKKVLPQVLTEQVLLEFLPELSNLKK
ncbi:hypothetical protein [Leptolyngbya sp. FACHB-261]|uniref:hypothetical protein n=1 Tax=Leptolyngbya sp. FACHB-261 TaxID=2692806 RepID=UPI00168323BD|nr:hypothetical protein [Leptolyngbya sp. FACHB-261]MBD2100968.1 hypothetical protein [Leptolyngbya sp. FACHB-261]